MGREIGERVVIALILWLALAAPVRAGFEEGKRAAMDGDYATALEEWRPLAEQGHADSQFLLGLMYREGRAVPQDFAKSAEWFRQAAEQGHMDARFYVGRAYRQGRGVAQDAAEAIRWLRLAAEQGHASAAFTVGMLHRQGEGVAKDDVEATRWYRKAAALGHGEAQFTLGAIREEGRGVERDFVRAYAWYSLAGESGVKLGTVLRQRVVRHLTPEQVEEARRLLAALRAGREIEPPEPEASPAVSVARAPPSQDSGTAVDPPGEDDVPPPTAVATVETESEPEPEPEPETDPETAPSPSGMPPEAEPDAGVSAGDAEGPVAVAATAGAGDHRVRLAAYRIPERAREGWRILTKAHGDLLRELEPVINRVDLGPEKGIFFRLEAGPLADGVAARELCGALRARSVECFVVTP